MSASDGSEYSRIEVRMGISEVCLHVFVSVMLLASTAVMTIENLRTGQTVWWPLVSLAAASGLLLAAWTLRAWIGRPMLVLDSVGIEQVLVGSIRWADVEFMRMTRRGHWVSRHLHTVLELRLRPDCRVLDRPFWLRWLPAARHVFIRIEGLEFKPERIRAVASALLSGGTWHTSLAEGAYEHLQQGTDPLLSELGSELERKDGDWQRLARIGRHLDTAILANKAEVELGLEVRRYQGRAWRLLAPSLTALVAAGLLVLLWK